MSPPVERRLRTDRLPTGERLRLLSDPGFGRVFSEHMVTATFDGDAGWHDVAVVPFAPLSLSPASAVLHYAQAVFEGLKAYAQPDGSVAVFRPAANATRFAASARRMAIPPLPEDLFVVAVEELVRADRDWVPDGGEASLYLRPLLFADDPALAVRPSDLYRFVMLASPVGSYFAGGIAPVTVWLSTDYARAAPGGTGAAKCAGNYGGSLVAQAQAEQHGCHQVVWLDAFEHRQVEELGGMNVFFVESDGSDVTLVTPPLTGTLLAGVVRDSLLRLAPSLGYRSVERSVTVEDWESGCRSGRITETFACGTAAVVTPVGEVRHSRGSWVVGDGNPGEVSLRVRSALLDLQHGRAPDTFGWMHPVDA